MMEFVNGKDYPIYSGKYRMLETTKQIGYNRDVIWI